MRIIILPPLSKTGRSWIFHSVVKPSSAVVSGESRHQRLLSGREFLSSLTRLALTRDSATRSSELSRLLFTVQTTGTQAATELKESLENAPPTSVKGRLNQIWNNLKSSVDSREDLFLDLHRVERAQKIAVAESSPTAAAAGAAATDSPLRPIDLIYPSRLSKDEVLSALHARFTERLPQHQKLRRYSIYWLPLSLLAGALPGPNIFIAWNAVRLLAHHNSIKGIEYYQSRYATATASRASTVSTATVEPFVFMPDDKLSELTATASGTGVGAAAASSSETEMIERVAAHLGLPSLIEHHKRLKKADSK